jgi:prephenate dehydratase
VPSGTPTASAAASRRYGFLGPEGTFAHAAARALAAEAAADLNAVELDAVELVPHASVTQVIDALRSESVAGAVVPLENSVEGAVPATLDELAGGSPLVIAAETYLPVVFDLLVRPGTELAAIGTIATHPHAEAQVRRFLLTKLPQARLVPVGSTAGGARAVAAGEFDAAVAPVIAGRLYGLDALAHDIADNPGAVTRFVLLTAPGTPPAPTGNDRTTVVTYLKEDHSGALLEILTEFSTRGINLTRIESRPTKSRLGQYCFSIDCEGHVGDARVGDALAALHRICADVRYLGSYPRRDGKLGPVLDGRGDADFEEAAGWLARIRSTGTG